MKIRRHSKRIAAKLASRPVRKPWTVEEIAFLDETIEVFAQTKEAADHWLALLRRGESV